MPPRPRASFLFAFFLSPGLTNEGKTSHLTDELTKPLKPTMEESQFQRFLPGARAGDQAPTGDYRPSQTADHRKLLHLIRDRLTQEDRLVFDLKAAGRTWTEISQNLGEPADSLRLRLTRAIARIKAELPRKESHDE